MGREEGVTVSNLMIKRVDPAAAATALTESIQEELPTAGVTTRTEGTPEQQSLAGAFGHEISAWFRDRERMIFNVRADIGGERPIRLHAGYVPVARGAGPVGILYETRLRVLAPAGVAFRRGRFRSGEFVGDPAVAAALSAVKDLGSTTWKFLQPIVIYNQSTYTIEPSLDVVPDDDGAVLVAYSAPARARFGLGGYRLDLRAYLDIAGTIERGLAGVTGVRPAPASNVPLPD